MITTRISPFVTRLGRAIGEVASYHRPTATKLEDITTSCDDIDIREELPACMRLVTPDDMLQPSSVSSADDIRWLVAQCETLGLDYRRAYAGAQYIGEHSMRGRFAVERPGIVILETDWPYLSARIERLRSLRIRRLHAEAIAKAISEDETAAAAAFCDALVGLFAADAEAADTFCRALRDLHLQGARDDLRRARNALPGCEESIPPEQDSPYSPVDARRIIDDALTSSRSLARYLTSHKVQSPEREHLRVARMWLDELRTRNIEGRAVGMQELRRVVIAHETARRAAWDLRPAGVGPALIDDESGRRWRKAADDAAYAAARRALLQAVDGRSGGGRGQ